ncbi:Hypothetical_protein [Hexamita inflata]|uniref:Hypothetical_protein n=1 Tax=Hexamita inflata TaxID=28002 RepID=A0AA86U8E5_9EUKA|nr:Hypothetical protein HINF_LOCUS34890 [Hexamita inflata]
MVLSYDLIRWQIMTIRKFSNTKTQPLLLVRQMRTDTIFSFIQFLASTFSCIKQVQNKMTKLVYAYIVYNTFSLTHIYQYQYKQYQLTTFLPEITDSFLSKHCCLAVARANEEAKLHYTSLITNALHEGTIATKQGQRDRQATGRRAPRAPPGLEGVGARQEGEAQGNVGSDGLGVTVDN